MAASDGGLTYGGVVQVGVESEGCRASEAPPLVFDSHPERGFAKISITAGPGRSIPK